MAEVFLPVDASDLGNDPRIQNGVRNTAKGSAYVYAHNKASVRASVWSALMHRDCTKVQGERIRQWRGTERRKSGDALLFFMMVRVAHQQIASF